jgi:formylmethanofuran dehydrogenase subunit E
MGRNTFGLEKFKERIVYPKQPYKVIRCAFCNEIKKSDLQINGKNVCFRCATKEGF